MTAAAPTLIDALNNEEGARLIDAIEDMLASAGGATRFATELHNLVADLADLTGYYYIID